MGYCLDVESKFDRCCGYSLKTCCTLISYINMSLSAFSVLMYSVLLVYFVITREELHWDIIMDHAILQENDLKIVSGTEILFVYIVHIGSSIALLFLGRYLYVAVKENNYFALHRWYIISSVILVIRLFICLSKAATSSNADWFFPLLGIIYLLYTIFLVHLLKRQIGVNFEIEKLILASEKIHLRPQFFSDEV